MINIELTSGAALDGLSREVKNLIKEKLTITNPKFSKQIAMGLSVFGLKQYETYYTNRGTQLLIPIGALPAALDIIYERTPDAEVILKDNRVEAADDFFSDKVMQIELRDFQKDLVDVMADRTIGCFQAKTGGGKTISFIAGMLRNKERTLILSHTKELVRQTSESITTKTNIEEPDIGMVASGKFDLKPVTLGTVQTLAALNKSNPEALKEVSDYFGQIIVDEAHIVPAHTYFDAITNLAAKRKYGFSATLYREDGLTDLITFGVGPIVYKVPEAEVNKFLVIPTYSQVDTDYMFLYLQQSDYQPMITHLSEDSHRNQFILDYVKNSLSYRSCFLCQRTSQVEFLHENIPSCAMLTSKMTKKSRKDVMEKLHSGEYSHVASTYGLFSTGIDLPSLSRLYLCAPIQSSIKLKQAAGRIMRRSADKDEAKIIDFVDIQVGILAGQARKRKRILTNL